MPSSEQGAAGGGFTHWSALEPCPEMVAALAAADARGSEAGSRAPGGGRSWSVRLVDACSRMLADEVRERSFAEEFTVLPDEGGVTEQPSMVVWERGEWRRRRVDVVVGDVVRGLQVGVSVKAAGSEDVGELIERLHELATDTEQLHAFRTEAVVAALCFVPLSWATKHEPSDAGPSRFARLVGGLRAMTGRDDPLDQDEWHRLDQAFVALYVPGDPTPHGDHRSDAADSGEAATGEAQQHDDPFPRGVVRYFDVTEDPPRRGRPKCGVTLSLTEVVDRIAERYTGGEGDHVRWAESETDPPLEDDAPPEP